MRYPKLRELKEAIKALIKGPYTTKFPFKPHTPFPKFRGRPIYYEKDCVGCGACYEVCPARAIEMTDEPGANPPMRKFKLRYDNCIFCGQCQASCITEKGVMLSNEFDMATFDRNDAYTSVDKELLLCEDCGEIIGAEDHIRFLAKKLGPLAFNNPLIVIGAQKDMQLEEVPAALKITEPLRRPHLFRILCPKCRRQVLLADEWGEI